MLPINFGVRPVKQIKYRKIPKISPYKPRNPVTQKILR